MINEKTIFSWWDLFKGINPLTEIRILGAGKTYSGYFTDPEKAVTQLKNYDGFGIYATLNQVKESCYGRTQHDKLILSPKSTTSDNDIERRRYILVDFDPKRPSDTNASEEEKENARMAMGKVFKFLRNEGFYDPIVADSANGYHLYYRVDMDNTQANTDLVKKFLYSLSALFSDDKVDIDTSVYNSARIVKIIGTTSNKGSDTEERPQRESKFLYIPETILTTPEQYVKKIADLYPEPDSPVTYNGYSGNKFDLDSFISEHGIKVKSRSRFSGGEKIILEECPFDHNHKDSAILRLDNGAISFKCFHNSCSQYTWKDFRIHFDPSAYSRKEYNSYVDKRAYYGRRPQKRLDILDESENEEFWLSMDEIKWVDPSSFTYIPSGITDVDKAIGGFALGGVSIVSGATESGKTTLLNHFILSAIQRGYKVATWSGELQNYLFKHWLFQTASGKAHVEWSERNKTYFPKSDVVPKIAGWLAGSFWVGKESFENGWEKLRDAIIKVIDEKGVQLILIDNLMAIDFDTPSDNDAQTRFIKDLKGIAKAKSIHVVLVCHPRKEQQLLRRESIAGTANLVNLCDNLLIVHRVKEDFEKKAKEFWGEKTVQWMMTYNLILEIAKNRSHGASDKWTGLYYEGISRRVKNSTSEEIHYGWEEEPTLIPDSMTEISPEPIPEDDPGDIPDYAWDEKAEKAWL